MIIHVITSYFTIFHIHKPHLTRCQSRHSKDPSMGQGQPAAQVAPVAVIAAGQVVAGHVLVCQGGDFDAGYHGKLI